MSAQRRRSNVRSTLAGIAAIGLCALGIRAIQPTLFDQVHTTTKKYKRDDAFVTPPPAQLRAMTFGYKNAAADLLWANLVLEYGLHWAEKRPFPDITRLIDAVIAIEPDHPVLYHFVDTMIVFTPTGAHEQEARIARTYLERGVKERKYDAELWLRYGQFLAFMSPSFLTDEAEIERWRIDGANAIVHSVELGANADRALSALTILRKAGDTKKVKDTLEKLYTLTDDPDTREQFLLKARQVGEATIASDAAISVIENQWHARYPFMTRSGALLVGPHRPVWGCAGPHTHNRKECAGDWSTAVGEP